MDNMESVQVINTAIIKSKERSIDLSYEQRLRKICNSPAFEAINRSITYLAEAQKISRDQSAIEIIQTLKELDRVWDDYVMMEGLEKLKQQLDSNENSES